MMARRLHPCLALLAALVLAGGCKVSASASTSSASDAKPDGSKSDGKPSSGGEPDGEGEGGGSVEGATLSPVPAKPVDPSAGQAPNDLSAGNACADAGHAPGDSWKDDCNTCNCTDAGEVVCTRMHCGGDGSAPH